VIPIYRGADDSRHCVESVMAAGGSVSPQVILVDDASPDEAVRRWLSALGGDMPLELLRNSTNRGFVASANLGMRHAGDRDVVLLNSDTVVCDGWLDRLAAQAYARDRVGTVTPFSNHGTICSYPLLDGRDDLPQGESAASIDAACAGANAGRSVPLPSSVGFCMYVRRDCLDEVGTFDERTFGLGYGEEVDFSRRALRLGWEPRLAADTFVWHRGEASFGAQAAERRRTSLRLIKRRYPEFGGEVRAWMRRDPARPFRVAATAARYRARAQVSLLVTCGRAQRPFTPDEGRPAPAPPPALVLAPRGHGSVSLRTARPWDALDLVFEAGKDEDFLARLLRSFGVSAVVSVGALPRDLDALAGRLRQALTAEEDDHE